MTFGELLRFWREQRKVSLAGLAQATYFSKGYLSRVERGLRNPERLLAELADDALGAGGKLIAAWGDDYEMPSVPVKGKGGEATKRRTFIRSAALASGVAPADDHGGPDVNTTAIARLRDALIPDAPVQALEFPGMLFARAVARARRDFTAVRYADLADCLSNLIPIARGAADPSSLALAAQVYHLTARTLIKLGVPSYAWVAAQQSEQAATASGDLRAFAEARRNLVSLFHRTRDYGKARDIAANAAEWLRPELSAATASAWGAYGALMSTGAIAAARMEDRHTALHMLEEADNAAGNAPKLVFSPGHVATYRIGVSIVLGDAGTAIEHARRVIPEEIPTLERRAGYYTGIAEAYALWGKTDRAVRALLVAEKIAPAEVGRPGPRQVISDLLHRDPHSELSGLRGLARRTAVAL